MWTCLGTSIRIFFFFFFLKSQYFGKLAKVSIFQFTKPLFWSSPQLFETRLRCGLSSPHQSVFCGHLFRHRSENSETCNNALEKVRLPKCNFWFTTNLQQKVLIAGTFSIVTRSQKKPNCSGHLIENRWEGCARLGVLSHATTARPGWPIVPYKVHDDQSRCIVGRQLREARRWFSAVQCCVEVG